MITELYYDAWNPAPTEGYPFVEPARIPPAFTPALWLANYGVGDVVAARAGAKLCRYGGKLPPLGDVPIGFPNQIVPPNTFYVLNLEGWPDEAAKLAITAAANVMPASRFTAFGFYPTWPPGIGCLTPWCLDLMEARASALAPWSRRMSNIVEFYITSMASADTNLNSYQTQLTVLRKYYSRVGAFVFPQYTHPPSPAMTPLDLKVEDAVIAMLRLYDFLVLWAPLAASIGFMERLAAPLKSTT